MSNMPEVNLVKQEIEEKPYPAKYLVYWPGSGDTTACENHAQALRNLWSIVGTGELAMTLCVGFSCANCVNEALV